MEHEISKRLKNEWMIGGSTLVDAYNKCPLVEENGVLIDMTKECFTFYMPYIGINLIGFQNFVFVISSLVKHGKA